MHQWFQAVEFTSERWTAAAGPGCLRTRDDPSFESDVHVKKCNWTSVEYVRACCLATGCVLQAELGHCMHRALEDLRYYSFSRNGSHILEANSRFNGVARAAAVTDAR